VRLDALSVSLLALEERHEPLRTTFEDCDGVGLQVVQPFVPKPLKIVNILDDDPRSLEQALQQERSTPFNLETEPGWRTAVFKLGEEDYMLSIVIQHIISDSWSVGIIQRELAAFYAAAVEPQAASLDLAIEAMSKPQQLQPLLLCRLLLPQLLPPRARSSPSPDLSSRVVHRK
jgi:hypothetical protein